MAASMAHRLAYGQGPGRWQGDRPGHGDGHKTLLGSSAMSRHSCPQIGPYRKLWRLQGKGKHGQGRLLAPKPLATARQGRRLAY